jgi:flagellar biogenesis protein FliO
MSEPRQTDKEETDAHSQRMFINLLAIIVCLLILIAGFWLMNKLWESKKLQDCVFSGRRNCGPTLESTH